jgi:hypothetical protein
MGALNKPSWAPQAIATPRGWADPQTGELLVGVRNLTSRMKPDAKPTEPKAPPIEEVVLENDQQTIFSNEVATEDQEVDKEPEVVNKTPAKKKGYVRKSS